MTVRLCAPQLTVIPAGISLHAVSDYLDAQFANADISLQPLSDGYQLGVNSHVFHVVVEQAHGKSEWLLKCIDPRNPRALKKLYAEVAFYHYCTQLSASLPVASLKNAEPKNGFLLLSFLQGKTPQTATEAHVVQCFRFIEQLNGGNDFARQKLGLATDAHSGLADVVADVEKRLAKKNQLLPRDSIAQAQVERDCYHFLLIDFIPAWQAWTRQHAELISTHNVPVDAVSPSDFGLHNTLQLVTNTQPFQPRDDQAVLGFFDFEYAGRDSYWKLLADMLAQPKIPLPVDSVIAQAVESAAFDFILTQSEDFLAFMQATLCKWVLIQLNLFFHSPTPDPDKLTPQLQQARQYWQAIPARIEHIRKAIEIQQIRAQQRGVVITGVQFS